MGDKNKSQAMQKVDKQCRRLETLLEEYEQRLRADPEIEAEPQEVDDVRDNRISIR